VTRLKQKMKTGSSLLIIQKQSFYN